MIQSLQDTLSNAWVMAQEQVGRILPKVLAGLLILIVGVLIARTIRALTARFLLAVRLDRISDRWGLSALLARGDVRYTVAEFVATVVYWLALLFIFELLGLALGMEGLASFFGQIIGYLPRIAVAIVIMLAGVALGSFLGGTVRVAGVNAGIPAAHVVGSLVKYLVSFFALVMALEQLKIATALLVTTLQVVIAAVAFAFALAFGLGCKDIAAEAARGWLRKSSDATGEAKSPRDEPPP